MKCFYIEEPTPEQRNQFQQQIDNLKETNAQIMKELSTIKRLIFRGTDLEMDMYITQNSSEVSSINL
ncbi:MAG: hypothetical protein NTZ83_04500 [Candidatus Pacearchaeota archaeon]|nr:hypothetical protein [Candidatus Pacearchaeota archaeon]